ncbi:GntR family transcriptional regulator [Microvirga brassicacearum]|uniref:GntR family transcriptional regulator n=1 Tax=Microvirga brassicacearum TaxID=2580413 RepID=A0A5N3P710_9HYPH|nr:GntR family transcriptional regulator [Microvirga brassicacearum]KAB0265461.1 GntR family transcriptional regulator [Microvirga brassicacearum]
MPVSVRDRTQLGELIGKPGETLNETLFRTLLEMIISGYFEEGFRLYPERLAEQFGVSLTPVREALMRLAAEGFIESVQRRGFHVRHPDAKQVVELWQVRLGLELTAGEILIERLKSGELNPDVLSEMTAIQAQLDAHVATISHSDKLDLNTTFHNKIVELSGNRMLASLYRGIQMQVLGAWVQRGLTSWRERMVYEAEEHHAIIDALRATDKVAYAKAARRHLTRSQRGALDDLAEKRSSEALAGK